jgi:hypothetical protein
MNKDGDMKDSVRV